MSNAINITLQELKDAVAELNKSYLTMSKKDIEARIKDIQSKESVINAAREIEHYDANPKPVEVLTNHTYRVVGHKENKVNGIATGISLEEKDEFIDLVAYTKRNNNELDWYWLFNKFEDAAAIRKLVGLGKTVNMVRAYRDGALNFQRIVDEYVRFTEDSTKPDPTSKSSLTKMGQKILDALVPDCPNKWSNKDTNFMLDLFMKSSKKEDITVQNRKKILVNLVIALHKCVTGTGYEVGYKRKESEAVTADSGEESTTETPATEPATEQAPAPAPAATEEPAPVKKPRSRKNTTNSEK